MHTDRHEVIVVGGGQAGLAIGYFLARQGRRFTILEASAQPAAAWRARWDSLRLFTPGAVQQPARPGVSGRPGQLSGPRRGGGLPHGIRRALRPAGGAEHPGARDPPDRRRVRGRGRRRDLRGRSGGGGHRAVPGAAGPVAGRDLDPGVVQLHSSLLPLSATTSRRARCWWWEAATPASRSPPSWSARTRCTCRWARARPPSPSASSAATSSATSWPPD